MRKFKLLFLSLHLYFIDAFVTNGLHEIFKKEDKIVRNQTHDTRDVGKPNTSLDVARTEYDKQPMSHLEHELMTCQLRMQILKWKQEHLPNFDNSSAEDMSRDQIPTTESNCVTSSELAREFAQMRDEIETLRISKEKTEQQLERLKQEHVFQLNKLQYEKLEVEGELILLRKPEQNMHAEVEKMKQNLNEIVNQSIQFVQDNNQLTLNNTRLETDNLILSNRLRILTQENNLFNEKLLEISRENVILKEKVTKFESNSKSLHLFYEDFVTEIEKRLAKDNVNQEMDDLKTQVTSLAEKLGKIEHELVNISAVVGLHDIFMRNKVNDTTCKIKVLEHSMTLINGNYHFLSNFKANWTEAQEYCQSRGLQFKNNDTNILNDFIKNNFTSWVPQLDQEYSNVNALWFGGQMIPQFHELREITYECHLMLPWIFERKVINEDCSNKHHFWCYMSPSACDSNLQES